MRLLILLMLGSVTLSSNSFAAPPLSGEKLFGLILPFENWQKCPQTGSTRCLLGNINRNETVWLLGQKQSESCQASVIKSFEYENEVNSFPLTIVNTAACKKSHSKIAVKTSKPLLYNLIDTQKLVVPNSALSRTIDLKIRNVALEFEPSNPQHLIGLGPNRPMLFRLPPMATDTYIAIYENTLTPGDQVHFLYSQGKVKLIHSAASISSVFSLGGKSYVHYTFTCRIGCGYGGDFIIEFSKNDFKVVMEDSSLST